MKFSQQIRLLLWKNYLLHLRKLVTTILKFVIPILFTLCLVLIGELDSEKTRNDIMYYKENFQAPSKQQQCVRFAPETEETTEVMSYLKNGVSNKFTVFGYGSEHEAIRDHLKWLESEKARLEKLRQRGTKDKPINDIDKKNVTHSPPPCAVIVFDTDGSESKRLQNNVHFTVRYRGPSTTDEFPTFQTDRPRNSLIIPTSEVSLMQFEVGMGVAKYRVNKTGGDPNSVKMLPRLKRFATLPYMFDIVQTFISTISLIQSTFILGFLLSVIMNTKTLIQEKEDKLKESMKLMGMHSAAHWISWFITFMLYLLPLTIVVAVVVWKMVLNYTAFTVVLVFLIVYALSICAYCFMLSTLFNTPNVGSAVAGVLFFLMYVVYFIIIATYEKVTRPLKIASMLLFNNAMCLGTYVLMKKDISGSGVQWTNLHEPAGLGDNNLSFLECLLMLLFDTVLYFVVAWYLDNVMPGEFGVPKKWNFLCKRSSKREADIETDVSGFERQQESKYLEREPDGMKAGIQLKGLRKVFGKHVAVAGTSLNMFEGQISVLLGHNGAGKTTTMSMLTGFIPPSSGTAILNGLDIRTSLAKVREGLGLCPQHDVLFGTMTSKENLTFFALLKGMAPGQQLNDQVVAMLEDVGLSAKINTRAQALSGGQKRKLSVAIALIGGSKVVILDEPTSGMDPGARRTIWGVLQRAREGRTILMCTHYMDEADMLGDRIAIQTQGVIACCGTPMFLKKLYGAGYHLIVVQDDHCDVDVLTETVQSHVDSAELETIVNREVTYLLPLNMSTHFASLFQHLDDNRHQLGIISFGTSATTMEEVFLKVGHDLASTAETARVSVADNAKLNDGGSEARNKTPFESPLASVQPSQMTGTNNTQNHTFQGLDSYITPKEGGPGKRTGFGLKFAQMHALFIKKAITTWRNKLIFLVQLVPPLLFMWFAMETTVAKPDSSADIQHTTLLDMAPFTDAIVPYTEGRSAAEKQFARYYTQQFEGQDVLLPLDASRKSLDEQVLEKGKELGKFNYRRKFIIGFGFRSAKQRPDPRPETENETKSENSIEAMAYWSGEPFHGKTISMNYLMNAFLLHVTKGKYSLQTSYQPLPVLKGDPSIESVANVDVSLNLIIGMAFLTSFYAHFLIKERKMGSKHLQTVSGVGTVVYWLPVFLWDFLMFLFITAWFAVFCAAYDQTAILGEGRVMILFLVIFLYGWAILPCTYVWQYVLPHPGWLVFINIITTTVAVLTNMIRTEFSIAPKGRLDTWKLAFMILLPSFNFGNSIDDMYKHHTLSVKCKDVNCADESNKEHSCCPGCKMMCGMPTDDLLGFETPGIGYNLLFMAIQGPVYFALLFLIDSNILRAKIRLPNFQEPQKRVAPQKVDSDVAAEAKRIQDNRRSVVANPDTLRLEDLYKSYGGRVVVDHVWLGVSQQECFGLLGQNGAGKTTIFKMLTGDVIASGGNAYVRGHDIRNNIRKVQAKLGYCPQFDALFDELTGKETLTFYARLRGVSEKDITEIVDGLLDNFLLTPHANKVSKKYSGGNKRKLSTALALIGNPAIVMLDEPTCGMDPEARRQSWNCLSQIRASGRTLMLTSHSMEECDALCTRIVIMVNGTFLCLGTPQQLKSKFGQGYTLAMKLKVFEDRTYASNQPVFDFIREKYPDTYVFDSDNGYLHVQVPYPDASLADVFEMMESTKENLDVEDYSVSQTSLEQVFLTLTRAQEPVVESKKGCCRTVFAC